MVERPKDHFSKTDIQMNNKPEKMLNIVHCCGCCSVTQLWPHELQHAKSPCPSPSPRVCPNSCSLYSWCGLAISSSDALFSFCPQSFPASGTFPMSWLFTSGDQNTSASASVLPMSIQGWFPLRLTGLIFTLSKGLSGVSSSTTVQRHQFSGALPSLWSSSHNRTWPLGRPLPWLYINIYRWSNVFAFQHSV